jgi:hypothetical protein
VQALLEGDPSLHDLGAPAQQLLQAAIRGRRRCPGLQCLLLMDQVAQQQAGVGGVGLGPATDAVAIAVQAIAVEQVHPVSATVRLQGQGGVKVVGGFQGEVGRTAQGAQPGADRLRRVRGSGPL